MIFLEMKLGEGAGDVAAALSGWRNLLPKLWARDTSLWTRADEDKWLGWLDIVEREKRDLNELEAFAQKVRASGFTDTVLIGMGGSSLGAEVLAQSFGPQPGFPRFHALDSTSPDQIYALEAGLDLARTLFIVASKSGSTLEPNLLKDYFHSRLEGLKAGSHFVAITDPGSPMEKEAREKNYAQVFYGDPEIGGRYSVLSRFGLVPAAAMGLDVGRLLRTAGEMAARCRSNDLGNNPGVMLGLGLGVLAAKHGHDKITISASPSLVSVGGWLEQLIAESTGKHGKGLIPVDREPLADPGAYGNDRVFLHVGLANEKEPACLAQLEKSHQPVIRVTLENLFELGGLFFMSEIAIAVAGSVLGINPFDQPDVEASKVKSRELTKAYESSGKLPVGEALRNFRSVSLYADAANAKALEGANTLADCLRAHFGRARPGDYIALLGFIGQSPQHFEALQAMRTLLRDKLKVATCAEFGPRFLHSTGQAYKGGPNSGIFLTLTAEPEHDVKVGAVRFGVVQLAQALGDFEVLNERGRRALRLHFAHPGQGLAELQKALRAAFA